jgi:hypothetical protein
MQALTVKKGAAQPDQSTKSGIHYQCRGHEAPARRFHRAQRRGTDRVRDPHRTVHVQRTAEGKAGGVHPCLCGI